jgi:hypothetical protein
MCYGNSNRKASGRSVRVGHDAPRTRPLASLPNNMCVSPVLPWVPMTITSAYRGFHIGCDSAVTFAYNNWPPILCCSPRSFPVRIGEEGGRGGERDRSLGETVTVRLYSPYARGGTTNRFLAIPPACGAGRTRWGQKKALVQFLARRRTSLCCNVTLRQRALPPTRAAFALPGNQVP